MLLQDYKKLFEHTDQVKAIYKNGQRVWPTAYTSGPDIEPFYVENPNNSSITLKVHKGSTNTSYQSQTPNITVEYSTDKSTWTLLGTTENTDPTSPLTLTISPNSKVYLKCVANTWAASQTSYNKIDADDSFGVGGNIMSLLYGDNFIGKVEFPENSSNNFEGIFYNDANLVSHNLLLPATTLTSFCYAYMFYNTSITTPPLLSSTMLANYCYFRMFMGCTSLVTTPVLSATNLETNCYEEMFNGCTSLTTAPELPATTLANYCYYGMFYNCINITVAPDLPAPTLVRGCYRDMFRACYNLNSIKCLATSGINTDSSTTYWVTDVASSGTFTKAAGVTWPTGGSGIPNNWTVVEE